jgi:hypothetical protein
MDKSVLSVCAVDVCVLGELVRAMRYEYLYSCCTLASGSRESHVVVLVCSLLMSVIHPSVICGGVACARLEVSE